MTSDSTDGPIVAPTEMLELGAVQNELGPAGTGDSPVVMTPRRRLLGYDLARFLAFVGMIAVNYRVVMDTSFVATGPEWLENAFGFLPGRAAALFVLLAGVGVTLMSRATTAPVRQPAYTAFRHTLFLLFLAACGLTVGFHIFGTLSVGQVVEAQDVDAQIDAYFEHLQSGGMRGFLIGLAAGLATLALVFVALGKRLGHPRAVLAKRAFFLFALGYAWMPLWTGDILHFYGVFLLVGAVAVGWRSWMIGLLLAVCVGLGIWWQLEYEFLTDWSLLVLEYKNPWTLAGVGRSLFFNGWHPIFPWLAFFLAGLLVGRLGGGNWKSRLALFLGGVILITSARFASPRVQDYLADKDRELVLEAFSVAPVTIADGSPILAAVKNENGSPRVARARIPLLIDSELDREANIKPEADARRLRRILRSSRDAGPYAEIRMALDRAEAEGGALLRVDLAHDTAKILPEHRNETFQDTAYRLASWMGGRRRGLWQNEEAGILGLSGRWPKSLKRVELRRLVPVTRANGEVALVVDRTVTLVQDQAQGVDTTYLDARRQMGLGCWPNPGLFFVIDAIGVALLIIATMLALVSREWLWLKKLLYPFATAGRMALTLYLAHILIGFAAIEWMEMLNGASLKFIAVAVISCAFVGTAGAVAWRAFFRLGPLEFLMRWLTR